MKKILLLGVIVTLVLLLAGCADEPYPGPTEGLSYELNEDGQSYSIVGSGDIILNHYEVVIPSTYQGLPVTGIGLCAFNPEWMGIDFDGIYIPNSVTSIGEGAFCNCSIVYIVYEGTKSEWEAIQKGEDWDANTPTYTIHCTDGDIVKE